MSSDEPDAQTIVADLWANRSRDELANVRKRLAADEEAFGLRMGRLFEIAKAHSRVPLAEVDRLLDHPAYEPRMTAVCILDFKARGRLGDDERGALFEMYLNRHDRITTWDMVDRAAPRVVGGYLMGRSPSPLHDLSRADAPLRRRTAITAPLAFVRSGGETDLAAGLPSPSGSPPTPSRWCTTRSAPF